MVKILPITFNSSIKKTPVRKEAHTQIKPIVTPTMTTPRSLNNQSNILIQNLEVKKQFEDFLNKKGKVTKKEYFDIKKNRPAVLIEARKYIEDMENFYFLKINPKTSAKLAILAKNRLDSLFGENNYKIVSVGTSPSFITEGMKELDIETVFVPMSDANQLSPVLDNITQAYYYPNTVNVGNYLRENVSNEDNKDIILIDYSFTGKTLQIASNILAQYSKIPPEKIRLMPLSKLLGFIRGNLDSQKAKEFEFDSILDEIDCQRVECTSNVPHYSVFEERYNSQNPFSVVTGNKSQDELFSDFDNFSRPSARAYQLCVLNELDILGGGI